ncbi:MAG: hypothetical protein NTW87_30285 [Planctomycetota bacterium]|nr:hypothetical protein [Planctomycetota bacterium]
MLPRDRVFAALEFRKPDVVPVEYHPSPAGLYEHRERLRELWRRHAQDFGDDFRGAPIPQPEPGSVDANGKYHTFRKDIWGVLWEYHIFGVAGHPVQRPLDDWAGLKRFRPPPSPRAAGKDFRREQVQAREHQEKHFLKSGWVSVFEVLRAVRRFEDVLMDIEADEPRIHRLADTIVEYQLQVIAQLLKRGVDAVQLGDDFGTQQGLMLSPRTWRRFFRPRYQRLMEPIHKAGKKVFFHSCGNVAGLLDEIAELGAAAIWPQLPLYDERELAARLRALKLAVALQPDRSHLMTFGTPDEVRAAVARTAETFRVADGGAWFYVEIDNGFPFANVRALIESVAELRER